MRTLILRNDEWLRGEGQSTGRLYRSSDGRKCCLGCYLRDLGMSLEQLSEVRTPARVNLPEEAQWLLVDGCANSTEALTLMEINDDATTSDAQKIALMTPLFAAHAVQLEFRP